MSRPDDQRRSLRCDVDLFVEEVVAGERFLHPAVDLGEDGVYILAADGRRAVDGRRELDLHVLLPGERPLSARGRVVAVDDHRGRRGLHIAFLDVEGGERARLRRFVEAQVAAQRVARAG